MPHVQTSEGAAAASAVPAHRPGGGVGKSVASVDAGAHGFTPSPPRSPDPEGTVAARDAREQRRVSAVLGALPRGSRVAVLSLLGSLNPITLGHVQMITEARRVSLEISHSILRPSLPTAPVQKCALWSPSQLLFCEHHCTSTLTNSLTTSSH